VKILALDAALGFFSAALDLDGTIASDRSDRNDALETGLGRIARLLQARGVKLTDLDRIAVGVGPGSFTGIRIALSFAKALAYAAHLPLVGISSYDILTPPDSPLPTLTVVAGRPGVICARFLGTDGATIACGPSRDVLDRLLANCGPGAVLTVAANTEDVLPDIGERHLTVHRLISPAAANAATAVALLARRHQPSLSAHALLPDYGELPAVSRPRAGTIFGP
jgi:tRNA threonylcarbamoyl adenosine modification protein YeaZ